MSNNKYYDLVAQNTESTVVCEYSPTYGKRAESYQSEAELERAFIKQLQTQAYEYLNITSEEDLKSNLRKQLEKLNDYTFSDNEWEYFFNSEIANPNQSIAEKTTTIQEDYIKILKCDDGISKNIYLIDKKNIHNNNLQVINQYATEDGQRANRYDVTVLVNGLPLVHIELKRRGVAIQEAFNQINRYQRESFWDQVVYLNMFNYLLFQTESIQNITVIPLALNISKKQIQVQKRKENDQAIVLNLLVGGRIIPIDQLLN